MKILRKRECLLSLVSHVFQCLGEGLCALFCHRYLRLRSLRLLHLLLLLLLLQKVLWLPNLSLSIMNNWIFDEGWESNFSFAFSSFCLCLILSVGDVKISSQGVERVAETTLRRRHSRKWITTGSSLVKMWRLEFLFVHCGPDNEFVVVCLKIFVLINRIS